MNEVDKTQDFVVAQINILVAASVQVRENILEFHKQHCDLAGDPVDDDAFLERMEHIIHATLHKAARKLALEEEQQPPQRQGTGGYL